MPIDARRWPAAGPWRDWLEFCDQIHRRNSLPSLRTLAARMHLSSASRVGAILRGLAWPDGDAQAELLLTALGAVASETERGMRLYRAARAERDKARHRPERPSWWLRSGYVEQVADIAPLDLLDRDEELAELADWCTGGAEAYVRWQAPPKAGKSALMAWFVLHPPPGVWVVSFFVTARLASQSDSTACTEALLDQLAAITGEKLPPVVSPAARDRLRRQLLAEAVTCATKAGARLVLLVDGLDEDCGTQPGSGLSSIAAMLPKRPPGGLKTIVTRRPEPEIPYDVDPDHPVLGCRVRPLAPSPHARQVAVLAQRELDEVLAADPGHPDGLGYQVLGLVTASGGGLDRHDLQHLTGRPAFELDRLLCGVFGRTIAGRADPHTAERVFLFTHETLREQATDRLGGPALAGFRARVHDWADGYRAGGWPADTPGYLLRGYPRLLADLGDLRRLVGLATDPLRHRRMLDATGGDVAALAEIAAAHAVNCRADEPDLLAAARLAWFREQLVERNSHLPTSLPAAWAALGNPIRGEALARSLPGAAARQEALAGLARALAASGERERAEAIAHNLPRVATERVRQLLGGPEATADSTENHILAELTRLLAGRGDLAQVAALAASTGSGKHCDCRACGLGESARAAAAVGDRERSAALLEEAMSAEHAVPHHYVSTKMWRAVIRASAEYGDFEHAADIARRFPIPGLERVYVEDPVNLRAGALAYLASALARGGDHERAAALAGEAQDIGDVGRLGAEGLRATLIAVAVRTGDYQRAEAIAWSRPYPAELTESLAVLASALAERGELLRAGSVARSVPPMGRVRALAEVAAAALAAGAHEQLAVLVTEAVSAARALADPHRQAQAFADLSLALAGGGDHRRATELAVEAESIARAVPDATKRAGDLVTMVRVVAESGDRPRVARMAGQAEPVVRVVADPAAGARTLAGLAAAVATGGHHEQAEKLARAIADPEVRAGALAALTGTLVAAGEHRRAESVARSIAVGCSQVRALAGVASALAGSGERQRARTLIVEAESITRSLQPGDERALALAEIAEAVAGSGDRRHALALIRAADANARSVSGPAVPAAVVRAAARNGDHRRARSLAGAIADEVERVRALIHLASGPDGAGLIGEAESIARSLRDPIARSAAFAEVIRAVAGDRPRAVALTEEAEVAARSIVGPDEQAQAFTALAGAVGAAQTRAAEGDPAARRARILLAEAFAAGRWAVPLAALARLDPATAMSHVDECWAAHLPEPA